MKATQNCQLNLQAGFTLIKIMIVVAIVGILEMLAIAVYQDCVLIKNMATTVDNKYLPNAIK